ncbi:MAG: type I restriction enzyme endonuclease domain-containing protein [Nitrospirota bacterium]
MTELSQAFALCTGSEDAVEVGADIGFFQAVKAALAKIRGERKSSAHPDRAARPLVAKVMMDVNVILEICGLAARKSKTTVNPSRKRCRASSPNWKRSSPSQRSSKLLSEPTLRA